MINSELAALFGELAELLDYEGENPFKVNAYRKAARVLDELPEDVGRLSKDGRLKGVAGIGEAIAKKILEYAETGKVRRYEEAKAAAPPELPRMLRIPGLGPRTLALINKHIGLTTLAELERAAREGRLRALPGLGEKKEENILKGIALLAEASARMGLGEALELVERVARDLAGRIGGRVDPAGSVRRMRETIGDLDLLVAAPDGKRVVDAFCALPEVQDVLAQGETKGSVRLKQGRQIDLRVVEPGSAGAALQYFTGSKAHNVHLRELARRAGLKINEYGVFRGEERIAGATEEDVYAAIGLPWIPPELREDRGEIERAAEGRLPPLVGGGDMRGDLHVHTTWSDGRDDVEAMRRAAGGLGYQYLAVSDHSPALKVFGGIGAAELEEQRESIRRANEGGKGPRVLAGAEVDIHADGSLDLPPEALRRLDIVTASIHSGFSQDAARMTARLVSAIRSGLVDVIGHPTGRLIGQRPSYGIEFGEVIQAAVDMGVALEVNSQPDRLDLTDQSCRLVAEAGGLIVINSDAHAVAHLAYMRLGVATARRGWVGPASVVNARGFGELAAWLNRGKRVRDGRVS